jgi:stearoyl-CoA desaturase (delta-9 desaturase)
MSQQLSNDCIQTAAAGKDDMSASVPQKTVLPQLLFSILRWFDSEAGSAPTVGSDKRTVDWFRILPFIALHVMCLGVIWVGWSPIAVATALMLYLVRMFAITGFYHRYFSHKTFRTGRFWQFVFAVLGNSAVQRGPLWWAAHHRHHHRYTDKEQDVHSPLRHGFWWSHIGWLTSRSNFATRMQYVKDWAQYPELRYLNRFDTVVPILLAGGLFAAGSLLHRYAPQLGTDGMQMLIWGFFVSTTVNFHATVTINSLAHMFGTRRYDTPDTSRNNLLLSIITLGEGWHNNHHHYAVTARQGFFWWEIDITYYALLLLAKLGVVRDLRPLPDAIRDQGRLPVPKAP